jgi:hypothetical protein
MSSANRFAGQFTTFMEENLESLIPFVPEMKLREGWARMAGPGLGIGLGDFVTRDGNFSLISGLGRRFCQ